MSLTKEELLWCDFAEEQERLDLLVPDRDQGISFRSFKAGLEVGAATERARVREQMLAWIDPKLCAVKTRNAGTAVEPLAIHDSTAIGVLTDVKRALDRICGEEE